MANRIWIDVEDLFKWGTDGHRPSGIQRLEFELCRALFELPQSKDRVFFLRHDAGRRCFTATSWEAVQAVFGSMSGRRHEELNAKSVIATARAVLKETVRALPPGLRGTAFRWIDVFISSARLVRAHAIGIARALQRCGRSRNSASAISSDHFASSARPGDILAALGAPWVEPDYGVYIERVKREKGLRFALLIYDIIPLRRPEWYDVRLAKRFRTWFADMLPLADTILTISAATAADVAEYAQNKGLALRAVPTPIPIGTGFKKSYAAPWSSPNGPVSSRLPAPNSYALMVSTIEPRKNHILLFRVWRRLMEDMRASSVPSLVFAGRCRLVGVGPDGTTSQFQLS